MEAFAAAGAGFLLAVLWFDLMHDVQARGHGDGPVPEPALASISGYYARVTTGARPMNRLVLVAMLGTVVALVVEIVAGLDPVWVPWGSLLAAVVAIGLARWRTVPYAVRLGRREDDVVEQSRLARTILSDHVVAFGCIAVVLVLQLVSAAA